MKKIVIFGTSENAEVAWYYFCHDSDRVVAAFTVDQSHIGDEKFNDLPVAPFENVEKVYPPESHELFVAMGYNRLNQLRAEKCASAKLKGYTLASYVSSRATVWPDLTHGGNCFILEDNTIQPFVRIGTNVVLWSGNHIGHHVSIGDNCFLTSHVVVSGGVKIGDGSFIGVNSTLRDHISVGKNNIIGAGSLILADSPDNAVYTTNPAGLSRVPSHRVRKI